MPKSIKIAVMRRIWGMPCVICGDTDDINVDHIVPKSRGGSNDESNLQPLCRQCNYRKSNRLTNDELRVAYEARKEEHHLRNEYRKLTRYRNPYDGIGFQQWRRQRAVVNREELG